MIGQKNNHSKFIPKTNTFKRIPSQSVTQNILQNISQNSSDFQTSFGENTSQKQDNILLNHQNDQCNKQNQQNYMVQSTNINKKQKSGNKLSTKKLEPPTKTSLNNIQQIDLQFLNQLKTKYQTQFLYKKLKEKTFDFNVQFYKHALQLILDLGFQYQPDYCFLCQQAQICENIHRLTQQYSTAVEENIQDIVKTNLQLSRKLCTQLKSKKIAVTVKKYLKMNGQSLKYKAGKLAFKAQVEKQLIEKAIIENNENFVEAVTVLCLLTNFGQIESIRIFLQQFSKYLKIDCFIQSSQQIQIKLPDAIRKYIVPLMNILPIGFLFIEGQPLKNLKKFLQIAYKNCQKMPSQQIKLLPSYYITYFAQLSNKEFMNIYTLKSQLKQFIQEHPICHICLKAVQRSYSNKNQINIQQNSGFCHPQCSQLIKFINTSGK